MKVNEVRIGNLISSQDPHFKIHRVSAINGNSIDSQPIRDANWTSTETISEFDEHLSAKPIALTVDWLLKEFGFEEDFRSSIENGIHPDRIFHLHPAFDYDSPRDPNLTIALNKNMFYHFKDEYSNHQYSKLGIEIRYVHQLQNLYYALVGEELVYKGIGF